MKFNMTTTESETKVEAQPKEEILATTEAGDVKPAETETTGSPKKTGTLKPAVTVHKKDFEKDIVYLYQLLRANAIPSLSACALEIETWLRMHGIQYEVSVLDRAF